MKFKLPIRQVLRLFIDRSPNNPFHSRHVLPAYIAAAFPLCYIPFYHFPLCYGQLEFMDRL